MVYPVQAISSLKRPSAGAFLVFQTLDVPRICIEPIDSHETSLKIVFVFIGFESGKGVTYCDKEQNMIYVLTMFHILE